MAWSPQSRRVSAIACFGLMGCVVAFGIRSAHRKPVAGSWLGHTYYEVNGELVKDETAGDFLIRLNGDGTYEENGNATSGRWIQIGDVITLRPTHFFELTPAEHREKGLATKGKVSQTIEMLLSSRMKPMVVNYNAISDRLVYEEPTMRYEYERMEMD